MTNKTQPELTAIAEQAGDELQIHYVSLSSLADKFLEGNSKLHSMSDLSDSIARYDFQDPMKFDSSLNGGNGGIVAGNGRLEWLLWAKDAGQAAPRGIKAKDDEWFVPVVFGVEFKDENEAIAFSISHNLSSMWGSDLTFLDQTRLFSEDLLREQLTGLADLDVGLLPVGMDGGDLDLWLGLKEPGEEPNPDEMWKGMPEFEQDNLLPKYSIKVNFASWEDAEDFARLINQKFTEKTKSLWHPEQASESFSSNECN
jgi:hypothetical protein